MSAERTPEPRVMPLAQLLRDYGDGDEHGWDVEFEWLRREHTDRLDALATSIQEVGMREPVLLGTDDRVWDGHHRLCVGSMLGLDAVPVVLTTGVQDVEKVTARLSAEHRIIVEGPLRYPGGKDGLHQAVCSEGDYTSSPGTAAQVAKHGRQHADAKNNAPCPSDDLDTGLHCTNTTPGHTIHSCEITWSDDD